MYSETNIMCYRYERLIKILRSLDTALGKAVDDVFSMHGINCVPVTVDNNELSRLPFKDGSSIKLSVKPGDDFEHTYTFTKTGNCWFFKVNKERIC